MFADDSENSNITKRRFWVKEWLFERQKFSHIKLVKKVKQFSSEKKNCLLIKHFEK